jgi:hypothetical protein
MLKAGAKPSCHVKYNVRLQAGNPASIHEHQQCYSSNNYSLNFNNYSLNFSSITDQAACSLGAGRICTPSLPRCTAMH